MTISYDETKHLCDSLLPYGKSELQWVTAEFAPFSSAMKPDIHFIPARGPYAGRSIFFEVNRKFRTLPTSPFEFFVERKQFAEEYLELTISRFVIFDKQGIDDVLERRLATCFITFIDELRSPDAFFESLRRERILFARS